MKIQRIIFEMCVRIVLVITFLVVWGERVSPGNYLMYLISLVMIIWIFIPIYYSIKDSQKYQIRRKKNNE